MVLINCFLPLTFSGFDDLQIMKTSGKRWPVAALDLRLRFNGDDVTFTVFAFFSLCVNMDIAFVKFW